MEETREAKQTGRKARRDLLAQLPPVGRRPHCLKCNREMEPNKNWDGVSEKKFGYMGNNSFCTQQCGFLWALLRVEEENQR